MLLVDTGVIVAAADKNDPHHVASAALLEADPGPLITSPLVIAEPAYLIERELGRTQNSRFTRRYSTTVYSLRV